MTTRIRIDIVAPTRVISDSNGTRVQPSTCDRHPHYLRLVGGNGEILMNSEDYSTRSNARRAARTLADQLGITDIRTVNLWLEPTT